MKGVFTEFTENYLITINNNSNFFNQDIKKETMLNGIKHDFDRYYYVANNYVKGLKRCFSYYKLEDAHKNKTKLLTLIDFFNSPVGLLYKLNGDLDVILTVLQFKEKRPSHAVFIKNLAFGPFFIIFMVMKLVAIGDIHGRDIWKQIVETEQPNTVVFVGDYFDSFDKS